VIWYLSLHYYTQQFSKIGIEVKTAPINDGFYIE
jgi:DNA mismatch repair protein MutH